MMGLIGPQIHAGLAPVNRRNSIETVWIKNGIGEAAW